MIRGQSWSVVGAVFGAALLGAGIAHALTPIAPRVVVPPHTSLVKVQPANIAPGTSVPLVCPAVAPAVGNATSLDGQWLYFAVPGSLAMAYAQGSNANGWELNCVYAQVPTGSIGGNLISVDFLQGIDPSLKNCANTTNTTVACVKGP